VTVGSKKFRPVFEKLVQYFYVYFIGMQELDFCLFMHININSNNI